MCSLQSVYTVVYAYVCMDRLVCTYLGLLVVAGGFAMLGYVCIQLVSLGLQKP